MTAITLISRSIDQKLASDRPLSNDNQMNGSDTMQTSSFGRRATDHLSAYVTSPFAAQVIGQFQHAQEIINPTDLSPSASPCQNAHNDTAASSLCTRALQDLSA